MVKKSNFFLLGLASFFAASQMEVLAAEYAPAEECPRAIMVCKVALPQRQGEEEELITKNIWVKQEKSGKRCTPSDASVIKAKKYCEKVEEDRGGVQSGLHWRVYNTLDKANGECRAVDAGNQKCSLEEKDIAFDASS